MPRGGPGAMEEEARAPIPAFHDQIISAGHEAKRRRVQVQAAMAEDSAAMSRRMAFDRPGDSEGKHSANLTASSGQAINQLFAAPAYNEAAPYHDVIQRAKAEGKWVLVNIQEAELFMSHALNRDVWSDDTMTELVTGSCLFWQRDNLSAEGDQFCQYHRCGDVLPHICVVDPRTGRSVKAWHGQKWIKPHEAAECLMSFFDRHGMAAELPQPPAAQPPAEMPLPAETRPPKEPEPPAKQLPTEQPPATQSPAEQPPAEHRAELPAELPEEPPEGPGLLCLSLRLPSGQRVARRFWPDARLEQLFAVASALSKQPAIRLDLCTQFPRRSLREVEGGLESTLEAAKVAGSLVVVAMRSV